MKTNMERILECKTRKTSYLDNTGGLGVMGNGRNEPQAADPIKNPEDIVRISAWLQSGRKYMHNMLFVTGCNTGLRNSDLRCLRFGNIIDENGDFYYDIAVTERKTAKHKKPPRRVVINQAVQDAFNLYAGSLHWKFKLDDFLFPGRKPGEPITYNATYRFMMEHFDGDRGDARNILSAKIHTSTHCLRKTYAYHFIMSDREFQRDPLRALMMQTRRIEILQRDFGHANQLTTLAYAGITDDEIYNIAENLNLGMRDGAIVDEAAGRYLPVGDMTYARGTLGRNYIISTGRD